MARLNTRELSMMDSSLRGLSQRFVELPTFRRHLRKLGIDLTGRTILDAGCGNGRGLELLGRTFQPSRLVGIDLMPEQIERARSRMSALGMRDVDVRVADITATGEPSASFDAVFVFGILHHVPAWRDALRELARVLRPGGVLLVEELHGETARLSDRYLGTAHPRAAHFTWPELRTGLADAGFAIGRETALVFGAVRSFAAIRNRPA
jgi:ubiquinone/menaquinone biosynthesis C-methylase UbiE